MKRIEEINNQIEEAIEKLKRDFEDPMVLIAGDFNKKPITPALDNFPDITELGTGPTRKDEALDLLYANFNNQVATKEIRPPLVSIDGKPSDHGIIHAKYDLKNYHPFRWKIVKSRPRTTMGDRRFEEWVKNQSWTQVLDTQNANIKAEKLVEEIDRIMNYAYPTKTSKVRSSDDPWITDFIREKIDDRMFVYEREGRSALWKIHKKYTTTLIRNSKRDYYQKFTKKAITTGDSRLYFQVVGRLKDRQCPPPLLSI